MLLTSNVSISALIIAAFLLVAGFAIYSRGQHPIVLLAAFYGYFAFGPVINHLLGNEIYFGTITEYISTASVMYFLAIAAMVGTAVVLRCRNDVSSDSVISNSGKLYVLEIICVVLVIFQGLAVIYVIVRLGGGVISAGKLQKIAILGSTIHYYFLALQGYVAAMYFAAQRNEFARKWYRNAVIGFILYCLVMSERDFIFLIGGIVMMRIYCRDVQVRVRQILGGAALIVLATYLSQLRAGGGGGLALEDVLNQGNLLFVDTYILSVVPRYFDHMGGITYWNSLLSLPPGQFNEGGLRLLQWFKDLYAPGADVGYGFSLEAEAYLNFGLWGVPLFFSVLTAGLCMVWNRIDRGPLWSYLSVLLIAQSMYSIRNDSLQLVKSTAYGILFFASVWVLSQVAKPLYIRQEKKNQVDDQGTAATSTSRQATGLSLNSTFGES